MQTKIRPVNNVNPTTFQELKFQDHTLVGRKQCIVQFPNGYGASIVQGEHTYGGKDGLYELAVFGEDGHITYDTPITDDAATAVAVYPTWVTANTGNMPQKVTSTKLSFVPSTGALTATGGISGGTF